MNSRFQLHEFTISTSRIHDFNFTNSTSRIQLHEFTNSTSRIHEFNFMNSRIQFHEFHFTNSTSRIHEFNFMNSRIQLHEFPNSASRIHEFNFTNSTVEAGRTCSLVGSAVYRLNNVCAGVQFLPVYLASHKRDIGKQCRPRSDAAKCGVWSGSTLFD